MNSVTTMARVYMDQTGAYSEMPILLTLSGPVRPLIDYIDRVDRSLAWKKKVVQAVALFLDYLEANRGATSEGWELFRNFSKALHLGTFDTNTGLDPSYLCWLPRRSDMAGYFITLLSDFFDWLSKIRPEAAKLNPRYAGSLHDQRIDQAAYSYRRESALLGHLWGGQLAEEGMGRLTRGKRPGRNKGTESPEFPDDRFEEFLFKGFCVGGKHDYRGMCITLLLHGAGFRVSEPFHAYTADINLDPKNPSWPIVLIHHPAFGDAPPDWRDEKGRVIRCNRAKYLAGKYALRPRTEMAGDHGAGWKNPRLDGNYFMKAYWLNSVYANWFNEIWKLYLKQVASIDRDHPFAFVNLHGKPVGGMYSISTYCEAHQAAVRRTNLPVGKKFGTTPHGHRHSYAQRARRGGMSPELIQRILHHSSIDSQGQYTRPSNAEIFAALESASDRLRQASVASAFPKNI